MIPDELLEAVNGLDDDGKLELFWLLRDDPALAAIAPEVTGLRYNYEAARILQEELEKYKASSQTETE